MNTRNIRFRTTLTALVWLAAAGPLQAGERPAGRFVMTVYEDMAQGSAILEGSAREMVSALTEGKTGAQFSFEENVNLCVAFTQLQQIAAATRACDAAMSASHKKARRLRRTTSPAYSPRHAKDVVAIALTNRGVVHALAGEHDRAREMFEAALELRLRPWSALRATAAGNLALLGEGNAAAQ